MGGGLEAGRRRGSQQVLEPARLVVQVAMRDPAATRQVGGATGQRPVGVVLDAAEGQQVVAQAGVSGSNTRFSLCVGR